LASTTTAGTNIAASGHVIVAARAALPGRTGATEASAFRAATTAAAARIAWAIRGSPTAAAAAYGRFCTEAGGRSVGTAAACRTTRTTAANRYGNARSGGDGNGDRAHTARAATTALPAAATATTGHQEHLR